MKLTVVNKSLNTIVVNEEKENVFNKFSSSNRTIKIRSSRRKQVSIGERSLSGTGSSYIVSFALEEQKNKPIHLASKYYELPYSYHTAVANDWASRNYFSRLLNNKIGTLTYNGSQEVSLQFKGKSWTIKRKR